MHIGFLGFGEAARAFQESLKAKQPDLQFSAWDILLDDPDKAASMRDAMDTRGVARTDPAGLGKAEWIISAVTADQSLIALTSIAPHLAEDQLVVDINSVSPGRKKESAALVEKAGAHYLDMAVMAPVHPRGHQTPALIAGAAIKIALPVLERFEFSFNEAGAEPGQATAIKMVRSMFVKGLEAITVETLLAAKASGCFEEIYDSISKSYPGLGWPDFAHYEFERTLRHGKRRAAEMRESAVTISALGLNGALAGQIADTQDLMGALDPDLANGSVDQIAGAVLAARLKAKSPGK